MRFQVDAPILSHERVADCEYEMVVHAPQVAQHAQPGQFLQVLYDESYNPFTRRPFSVFHTNPQSGEVAIVYLARGVFTQGMRRKRPGETLSLVGPLGNAFQRDSQQGVRHILVGGGVGLPPLYFFARELRARHPETQVTVINGARTRDLLVGSKELEGLDIHLVVTTDDGTLGQRGRVTDALKPMLADVSSPARVYACGPTAMLRAVSVVCSEVNTPCDISVETMMPCGVGVCMGCVVKVKTDSEAGYETVRSCYEGPVFESRRIIWE